MKKEQILVEECAELIKRGCVLTVIEELADVKEQKLARLKKLLCL